LIIKLKNKNDDLLVKTLVSTDQTIIYNTIMEDIYKGYFSCDKINLDGNTFIYEGETIVVVSEYASIGNLVCDDTTDETRIHIPINVKQIPDDNFDVKIGIGDGIEGNSTLSCSLEMTSANVIKLSDDFSFSGRIIYQGFDSNYEGNNVTSKTIGGTGTYTYYIKAKSGLNDVYGNCSVTVANTVPVYGCPDGYTLSGTTCSTTHSYYASASYSCDCGGKKNVQGTCDGTGFSSYYNTDAGCQSYCYANYDMTCGYSFSANYYCDSGYYKYPLASGGYGCQKTSTTSATISSYGCSSGYTKANNSYCWK